MEENRTRKIVVMVIMLLLGFIPSTLAAGNSFGVSKIPPIITKEILKEKKLTRCLGQCSKNYSTKLKNDPNEAKRCIGPCVD
ncbi:hypothetical protein TorRG33x02_336540, partial [Trema orientale]